ncbi:uncharacterized protein ARMOST_21717 [Armillaria ostoyae]|uniref:Uncharacterized protein n=1 Tax=Armillaria ostoyae TaxID=47428 RepID=A0A284SAV2_ARMOS|nr:uncharacterized protein ARMOST_21717 [Armillaria ostoyae]
MSDLPLTSTTTICAATDLRDNLQAWNSVPQLERTVGALQFRAAQTAHGDVLVTASGKRLVGGNELQPTLNLSTLYTITN